jgi:uncharacterized membrane protein YhaH (DUF805 family)
MILQNAVKDCSKKSTVFEGRASRYEYLPVFLSCCIVIVVMAIMYTIVSSLDSGRYSLILYIVIPFLLVAYGICTIGLHVNGFNEIGFVGWIVFLFFMVFFFADFLIGKGMVHDDQIDVIIGVYALMAFILGRIILLALPGAKGANQYGDDPLAHASQDGVQYNDGGRDNNRPNASTTTIDQLERLDSLRTTARARTKSRLVAISVLFLVLFVVYLLVSNQEGISAEAKQDKQAKEETNAIGLSIKVTDDFDRMYYGKVNEPLGQA